MTRQRGSRLLLLVAAFSVGAALYWYTQRPAQDSDAIDLGVTACDAAQAECTLRGYNMVMTLRLHAPVQPLVPFDVSLQLRGERVADVESVELAFSMRDMEMGVNVYRLQRVDDDWRGEVVLPVCTRKRSDWLATVTVRLDNQSMRGVYPFTTR